VRALLKLLCVLLFLIAVAMASKHHIERFFLFLAASLALASMLESRLPSGKKFNVKNMLLERWHITPTGKVCETAALISFAIHVALLLF
jgi:hypothetical protein